MFKDEGRTSEVLIGVNRIGRREDYMVMKVRRIVIHSKGYQGGMYGE